MIDRLWWMLREEKTKVSFLSGCLVCKHPKRSFLDQWDGETSPSEVRLTGRPWIRAWGPLERIPGSQEADGVHLSQVWHQLPWGGGLRTAHSLWMDCPWGSDFSDQRTLYLWEGWQRGGLPVPWGLSFLSFSSQDTSTSGASAAPIDATIPGWMGHSAFFWRSHWLVHFRCSSSQKKFHFRVAWKLQQYVAIRGPSPCLLWCANGWLRSLQCTESRSHMEEFVSINDKVIQPQRLPSCLLETNAIQCPEPLSLGTKGQIPGR